MSDSNYRSSCGGAPSREGNSLPSTTSVDNMRQHAAVPPNAGPPVARSSASQSGVNSSESGGYWNNPYGPLCVQNWDRYSQSHWSAYTRSHNDPVAYSNDSQWHSSEGGGGWALSEARYPDDDYNSVNGMLPNRAQVLHNQAHGFLTTGDGWSQERGPFPQKNDGFDGTPHEFPEVRRVQMGSDPTDDDGYRHATPLPTTADHRRDSQVSHVARKRRRSIQSRHASQGAPRRKPSPHPKLHSCQKHDVPGESDSSNEEKTRSPTSGDKGGSYDSRAPPPPPPHTSPLFDSSKPITVFLIVKCKRDCFRYPTTLQNYQQELPIGTDVVVWRDGGEAIGKVIEYVSIWRRIQDLQRAQRIGEARPREIFGDQKKFARVLRKATNEDIATRKGRQEEEREKLPGVAETVAKNSHLVPMKSNSTPQLHDDNATGSTVYWVEDMGY